MEIYAYSIHPWKCPDNATLSISPTPIHIFGVQNKQITMYIISSLFTRGKYLILATLLGKVTGKLTICVVIKNSSALLTGIN